MGNVNGLECRRRRVPCPLLTPHGERERMDAGYRELR